MEAKLKSSRNDKVIYLYALTEGAPAKIPDIAAVDGAAPIETVECRGVTAWISRVSRTDFAENLAQNMENLDWLADMSVRHQQVVAAIARGGDALPVRFGTVYLNPASLRTDVAGRKSALAADFARIAGSEEYGVKVIAARPEKIEVPLAATGKGYLQAKSAMLRLRTTPRQPDDQIRRFAAALGELAEATAEGGRIGGAARDVLYHVSVLLKRTRRKRLEKLVQEFAGEWGNSRRIECTGPWPPYSFVSRTVQ